jgi:8-oxo-dGTP diphosphatase
MMSDKQYHQTLPSKRMASGALLWNDSGKVLIVEPSYKILCELPGGVVESGESPLDAVVREVREELGLVLPPAAFSLASIDYLRETEDRTEALQFVWAGTILTSSQIDSIRLPSDELSGFAFVTPEDAQERLGPVVGPRLLRAVSAIRANTVAYWQD